MKILKIYIFTTKPKNVLSYNIKISRFLINIIKMCNIFGMNEYINNFSSILVHNMDNLLCFCFFLHFLWCVFILVCHLSIHFLRLQKELDFGKDAWIQILTLTQYYSPNAPTIFHFAPKFKVILLIKQNMYIEKEKMKNMLMTKDYHP